MPDWLCSPHTCYMAGWLYDFQTLTAGILAFVAGAFVLLAAGIQFKWEKFKRQQDAQSHEANMRRDRQSIMLVIAFEYVHRAAELIDLFDGLINEATAALHLTPAAQDAAAGPLRARASLQVRESVRRGRAFCASAHKELTKLETNDHVQRQLSLIRLEGALLKVETAIEELDRIGGHGANALGRLAQVSPTLRDALRGAIDTHPSGRNPTPFELPDDM